MEVRSLGYRTDLMLRRLAGSTITDRGEYLVVRTPQNPGYYWGNFILVPGVVPPAGAQRWLDLFAAELPDATHVAVGVDSLGGEFGDIAELLAAGLTPDVTTVLTAGSLHEPRRPNRSATVRTLHRDTDWEQALALRLAATDLPEGPSSATFLERRLAETRRWCDAGYGAFFGAFVDGSLRSGLGLFSDGNGVARYQEVETHPDFRNQGLASTLVHAAGSYGFERLGANVLVIVADPDYVAIGIYRSLGFADTERMVGWERRPSA